MSSIYKRERNTLKPWRLRWRDASGAQHETGFATKLDAESAKRRLDSDTRKYGTEGNAGIGKIPFAGYAAGVIGRMAVSEGTRTLYLGVLDAWVGPWAGNRTLREVAADRERAADLLNRDMTDRKTGKLLSYNRRGIARTVMTAALDEAVRAGKLTSHRLADIPLVRSDEITDRKDFVFPAHAQVAALADGLGALGMAVWLARGCGLRVREALAVCREDFRDNGSVIRVSGQASLDGMRKVPLKHRKAGQFRDVPVPAYLWEMVKGMPEGPIVSPGNGKPYFTYSVAYKQFVMVRDAVGISRNMTWHSLRHAFATALLRNSVPIHIVSQMLGHLSAEVTTRIYAHVIPSDIGRVRSVLESEYETWKAELGR